MKITTITLTALAGLILVSQPVSAAVVTVKNAVSESLTQVYSTPLTRQDISTTGSKLPYIRTDGYVYKTVDNATGAICYIYAGAGVTPSGGISCVK